MCFLARSDPFGFQLKLVFIRIPRLHYRLSILDDLLDAHQCLGGQKSWLQNIHISHLDEIHPWIHIQHFHPWHLCGVSELRNMKPGVRFTRYDDVSNDWPQQNQRGRGYRVQNASCPWPKVGKKKACDLGDFPNNPLDVDVWRTTGAQAITWCTMTFQKFSSKRSSVFCKTSLLDTILNLRMCDLNTIPPHTGFARVSLFSFQDVF